MKIFPELPPIRRCHDYKIKTKFTYKCINCGYRYNTLYIIMLWNIYVCVCVNNFEIYINLTF